MHDAPDVPVPAITAMLQDQYGVPAPTLTFLPLGNDSATLVFRVEAADRRVRFLKLRAFDHFREASLLVPLLLRERGVPNVLAPLSARDGAAWVRLGAYAAVLYPFLAARTAREAGLGTAEWRGLGATLRQVHDTHVPATLRVALPSETFTTAWHERVRSLEARLFREAGLLGVGTGSELAAGTDPVLAAIVTTWREHGAKIHALVEGADTLEQHMPEARPPHVLCHADFHTWNVLVDGEAGMWIVDWDEVVLAPKERDLMFVVGGIGRGLVQPHETASFLEGYGETEIDPQALAYYRYAWALQDVEACVGDALADMGYTRVHRSEAARWAAANGFATQFEDGNMVDIALGGTPQGA